MFGEKNLISFGTFPYALCNLTFTNKLFVKGQNKKNFFSGALAREARLRSTKGK